MDDPTYILIVCIIMFVQAVYISYVHRIPQSSMCDILEYSITFSRRAMNFIDVGYSEPLHGPLYS